LGAIANETNDAASCLKHSKQLFEIRQRVATETGIKDYRYASGYAQLATALMMNDERENAIKMYKKSIEEFQKAPGFTKAMLSVPLADLGFALWLNGELEEAALQLLQGIKDREELFGKNDRESFR
jgi:tetratricopeptide (TPR) repeat protein